MGGSSCRLNKGMGVRPMICQPPRTGKGINTRLYSRNSIRHRATRVPGCFFLDFQPGIGPAIIGETRQETLSYISCMITARMHRSLRPLIIFFPGHALYVRRHTPLITYGYPEKKAPHSPLFAPCPPPSLPRPAPTIFFQAINKLPGVI